MLFNNEEIIDDMILKLQELKSREWLSETGPFELSQDSTNFKAL